MSMKDRVHDEIAWNENSARKYSLMSLRRKIHLEVSKRLRALLASPEEPGLREAAILAQEALAVTRTWCPSRGQGQIQADRAMKALTVALGEGENR